MAEPNVLGLDISLSNSGAARIYQTGQIQTYAFATSPAPDATLADESRRRRSIFEWAVVQRTAGTELVVIEDVLPMSTIGKARERATVIDMIVDYFTKRVPTPVALVNPKSLKAKIAGRGDADKDEMGRAIVAIWPGRGLHLVSNDEWDGVGLATLGTIRLAAHHGPDGPWKRGPWLDARALNLETGCRWPDLGPGWVKPKPAPLTPLFAVPS